MHEKKEYETTRKEFYAEELRGMADQVAELLDDGFEVIISRSRSGLKLFSTTRHQQTIRHKLDGGNEGR